MIARSLTPAVAAAVASPARAAAPAVYREPGGVPTPPNLRPFSCAGTALGKGLPVRDAR